MNTHQPFATIGVLVEHGIGVTLPEGSVRLGVDHRGRLAASRLPSDHPDTKVA